MRAVATERRFHIFAVLAALLVMVVVVWVRFFDEDIGASIPPLPAKPAPADPALVQRTDYSPDIFAAYLEKDAQGYSASAPDVARLGDPFPYELSQPRVALPIGGAPFETRTLRIAAREKRGALVLEIENRTDQFLAYRVVTTPSVDLPRCLAKPDLVHNAVALKPREKAERSECVGGKLSLESVESVTLPELGYYYVSRLPPTQIGLDPRTSRAHKAPKGEACAFVPEQAIRLGIQKGTAGWHDVVDFYARHRCETYLFPVGYRAISRKGERALPVSGADVGKGH